VFAPPLVIERRDIDELVSKFESGLEAIGKEVQ
jgi:acetylornithine/succinyldiaminopimelate/putrescine aminotransferase